jgi:PTH1 family peptidyl-tRNA hydrolase
MKLVVGLGNPGKQYEKTRHNVGFMIMDALQETLREYDISEWQLSKKFNAEISGCTVKGEKIILAKPMTFMNASGQSVQLVASFYKISARDIVVAHDDKDIPIGTVKVQTDRGAGGHNGIQSIIDHIGTKQFTRVRAGIASQHKKKMQDTAKFVLGKFGLFEKKLLDQTIQQSVDELSRML